MTDLGSNFLTGVFDVDESGHSSWAIWQILQGLLHQESSQTVSKENKVTAGCVFIPKDGEDPLRENERSPRSGKDRIYLQLRGFRKDDEIFVWLDKLLGIGC